MSYLKIFIFFSIIGYIFEEILCFVLKIDFNSGILYGPYTPIYGLGILIIIIISNYIFKKFNLKKYQETIITGGILFFTITILELLGGILIEKTFNKVYWSYENMKLHYGNYISIEVSFIWTILGIIIYYCKNFFYKIISKIPNIIYYIISILFIIDIVITYLKK